MRKFNQKDEALVQAGVSLQILINSHEITVKEAADSCNYSIAAGYFNIITGLQMALKELGSRFEDAGKPDKVRIGSFFEAVNERLSWIREEEKQYD